MTLIILFMGTPVFAVPILKSLFESEHKLLSVYTQPPKKRSRGQKKKSSPIHEFAEKIKVPVRCPDDLNTEQELNFIKNLKPNIVIVVAFGKIIPKKILELPNITFINIHASILPKWRGAAPIQRAIMNMDKETGISIMKIIYELDAGPVMKTVKIKITPECNFETLSKKISNIAASTIIDSLVLLEKKAVFTPQDDSKASDAKKIDKSESKINWNENASKIIAKINALHPNPGSWFEMNGSRIKVLEVKEVKKKGKPGEIVDNEFTIACNDSAIEVLKLKKEGKNSMAASDYLRGNNLKIGTILNGA